MTVFVRMISGIQQAPPPFCSLQKSCDSYVLEQNRMSCPLDLLKNTQIKLKNPDSNQDDVFWKVRTIVGVGVSDAIVSVTFVPSIWKDTQDLFIQKNDEAPIGFVAPYLSEEQQKQWNASTCFSTYDIVTDLESIESSISGYEGTLYDHLKECLTCFINDKTTHAIGITFIGPDEQVISHGWIKSSSH